MSISTEIKKLSTDDVEEIKKLIRVNTAKDYLEQLLSHICAGNEGYAEVDKFEVNFPRLTYHAILHHKHTTKIMGRKIIVYAADTTVEGEFDLTAPSDADVRVCTPTPIGDLCCDISDLIPIIIGLVK